jgi:translation initiation factor IF-2
MAAARRLRGGGARGRQAVAGRGVLGAAAAAAGQQNRGSRPAGQQVVAAAAAGTAQWRRQQAAEPNERRAHLNHMSMACSASWLAFSKLSSSSPSSSSSLASSLIRSMTSAGGRGAAGWGQGTGQRLGGGGSLTLAPSSSCPCCCSTSSSAAAPQLPSGAPGRPAAKPPGSQAASSLPPPGRPPCCSASGSPCSRSTISCSRSVVTGGTTPAPGPLVTCGGRHLPRSAPWRSSRRRQLATGAWAGARPRLWPSAHVRAPKGGRAGGRAPGAPPLRCAFGPVRQAGAAAGRGSGWSPWPPPRRGRTCLPPCPRWYACASPLRGGAGAALSGSQPRAAPGQLGGGAWRGGGGGRPGPQPGPSSARQEPAAARCPAAHARWQRRGKAGGPPSLARPEPAHISSHLASVTMPSLPTPVSRGL